VAELRLVSVLFADLVGFTPFAEGKDAEEVRETLSRYFELARDVIGRYGGNVEKFIGDAVMAVWGAPTAQEDDAERAVRAALDLVGVVPQLGPGIQARAGVLTGEAAVTVGATGQGMVAGDLVNTASRLQSVAEPGTVLVGESTQRAANNAIAFERQTDQMLKGKAAPVTAWRAMRVVAERGGRNRSEQLEAPFVGREDEMRLLRELFHATNRERRPRLVSVIGPGGIGKSRLAWEFLKYVDGLQQLILWHDGRSPSYGEGITFWALGEMVRERAALRESDNEQETRAKIAACTANYISDEDERRTVERSLLALLGFETGVDAQQLFGAWRTFFERLADQNPVVMVFEDLHFADPGLLDFIDHVLEWSRQSPITIVTLARPELLDKRPTWGAGKRSFSSIYLEPLTAAQMRELLAGLVPGLPASAVKAIVGRADGIPLYAVETVRMLVADGLLVQRDGTYEPTGDLGDIAVPDTLTALIAARLDGLDAPDRALLSDAAVLGQSFSAATLASLAGAPAASLEARLATLARRELIRREMDQRSPELGQYGFVQALIREVAYNTLSKKDRKTRHVAAARYFESVATEEVAGALASHYLAAYRLAGEGPEADALATQARLALKGAADRAVSLHSPDQAVSLLLEAVETTSDIRERGDLLERAAELVLDIGSSDLAVKVAEDGLAARRTLGDPEKILLATANMASVLNLVRADTQAAYDLAEATIEEFPDALDTAAGVRLLLVHSGMGGVLGHDADRLAVSDRALPLAERFEDPNLIIGALISRSIALMNMGRSTEGTVVLRGAHEMAVALGMRDKEIRGRVLRNFVEQWGDPSLGLVLTLEGIELAKAYGSTGYWVSLVGNGTICALRVGDWDWIMKITEEGSQRTEGIPTHRLEFTLDRILVDAARGRDVGADLDEADRFLESLKVTDPQFGSYNQLARSWAYLAAGKLTESAGWANRAADGTVFFNPLAVPIAARAALWGGDLAGARAALAALEAKMYRGRAITLDKQTARAGIAALEGHSVEALAGYREALRGWRQIGCAFDEALAAIDMVSLLHLTDAESLAEIDWARETLTRLGAKPYLDRLEAAVAGDQPSKSATRSESVPARQEAAGTPAA
jgi:class 3 adenylate cyclase